jgi:outer membrane protein OmpA-like peptidoglycan-associated protein
MFSLILKKKAGKSEGESPFWISFSDLMTALMTLFLVVMAVTLISIQKSIPESIAQEAARQKDIKIVMALLKKESLPFVKVRVDEANYRLDLGDIVYFESGSHAIRPEVAAELRAYIPTLLKVKRTASGNWIKRFIVEGFTDQDGSYTLNLELSTKRSRSVICALVSQIPNAPKLTEEQVKDIQRYFSLGGFSSYSIRQEKELSRRVEIRVEFWTIEERSKAQKELLLNRDFGEC